MAGPNTMTTKTGPTNEIGTVGSGMQGLLPWGTFVDDSERAPELTWPNSVQTYNLMRTDAQIHGLMLGTTLPIRRYRWMIDPNGASDEAVQKLSDDLQLDIKGKDPVPKGRRQGRFSFDDHLRHALLALFFGHMFFEQVGEVQDDGMWHLRKLGPRMPQTVSEINVSNDGGLNYIKQAMGMMTEPIPVTRLVAYVWEKEGGNWIGRSMLRPLYKHWLIKDRLLRIDAINHERAGAGIPIAEAPVGATDQQIKELSKMAQTFKAGESAGGAVPAGAKLTLQGVQGIQPDTIRSIRYHDESMARAWLMMFMQLGQTETGSRALGDSFIDFFGLSQETVALWFSDVFTMHVVEDWVEWNFGPDENAPLLVYERNEDPELATADLVSLVDKGIITVDPELEETLRAKYGLPEKPEEEEEPPTPKLPEPTLEPPPPSPGTQPPVAKRRGTVRVEGAAPSPVALPDRPLRRQPYDFEVLAKTDFADIDLQWQKATDALVPKVKANQKQMIESLHDAIVDAGGDLDVLASLSVEGANADIIYDRMSTLSVNGAKGAVDEIKAQGHDISVPDLSDLQDLLRARADAVDQVLARSLSESAARKSLSLTGGSLDAASVADATKEYMLGLSDSYLGDQLGGAMQAAINSGRKAVFRSDPPKQIYSSELLDNNTCENCTAVDGTEYLDIEAAEGDYPTGGFMDCLGGPRCRGTLVAVYDEAEAS